jgi:CheY-like chemotaxis protein
MMQNQIKQILLAEDRDDEYSLFVRAVNAISNNIKVMRLDHGYNLLAMLQTDITVDAIFLDINMPYKNGLLTLKEIREMPKFQHIPIVILTSSTYPLTIKQAFQLGATFYANKSWEYKELKNTLSSIFNSSYFQTQTRPPEEEFYLSPRSTKIESSTEQEQ